MAEFKMNKKLERQLKNQTVEAAQDVVDGVQRKKKGAPAEEVAEALQRDWKKAFGGKLPDETVTAFAENISAGGKPKVEK